MCRASGSRLLRLDLPETGGYQFLHEHLRKGLVNREMQRTLCARVACEVVPQLGKHGTAVRQVGEVVLEGCESRDHLAFQPERRHAVRDDLLGIREDVADGLTQLLKRRALGLSDLRQVVVNLWFRHDVIVGYTGTQS